MTWTPLLDGPIAARAREAIDQLALSTSDLAGDVVPDLGGVAGAALLHGYVARAFDRDVEIATALLERAVDGLASQMTSAALHTGFTGIAWVVEHLARDESADDPNSAIDLALEEGLGVETWHGHLDVITGLAGYAVYFLERAPRAGRCLDAVVRHVERLSERRAEGLTWHLGPRLMSEATRALCPDGHYNLGVSHGVPGLIAALAGIDSDAARRLISDATTWLLAHREASPHSQFGCWVVPPAAPVPARPAWCYGDPGVAVALLRGARAIGDKTVEAMALEIARVAAARPIERTGIVDGGLCHGTVGLAHIFARLFSFTGEAIFADAARRWYAATLDMMREPPREVGFLTGRSGMGLGLIAAISDVEPGWDRLLLLSHRTA